MKASTMRPRELGPSGPSWFPGEFDGVVGSSHPCRPVDVSPVRNLLSCNMSFRQVGTDLVGVTRSNYVPASTSCRHCPARR
jgi:hypothetical protein